MNKQKEHGLLEVMNHELPKVSILCVTFNHVNFIKNTLDGFLLQKTTFPIEIIIHDDASQDGTSDIIREYEILHPGIFTPIYQIENQFSKRVDIGKEFIFPKIRGKYIAYCEGDDYWIDPLKLQKQVDFLEQNQDYGLVYTDIDRINEKGDLIDQDFFKNNSASFCETFEDYLINAPFRAPCTWLFRSSLHKEANKNYVVGDLPILLDIAAKSKIYFLHDTTAHYRVLTNSASHSNNIDHFYTFSKGVYNVQLDYAKKYNVEKKVIETIKIRFALQFYDFAIAKQDLDQIRTANKLLMQQKNLSFKFKVAILLSKYKLGRKLVRYRLIKRLGFTHS